MIYIYIYILVLGMLRHCYVFTRTIWGDSNCLIKEGIDLFYRKGNLKLLTYYYYIIIILKLLKDFHCLHSPNIMVDKTVINMNLCCVITVGITSPLPPTGDWTLGLSAGTKADHLKQTKQWFCAHSHHELVL